MKQTSIYHNNPQQFFTDFQARNEKAVSYARETILPYIKNLAKPYRQLRYETDLIANDVIMKGFEQIEKGKFVFQEGKSPMAYLFRIAKFGVKSAAKPPRHFCDIATADEEENTYHYQPNWENRDIVTNILRQLPKEHRKLFLLRLKGYEYNEMEETKWLNFSNAKTMKVIFNKDKGKLKGLGQFLA